MPGGRPHSVSSIDTYLTCPHLWFQRYVKRNKGEESVRPQSWRLGSSVHASLERAYKVHQTEGPKRPAVGDTMARYETTARERLMESLVEEEVHSAHGTWDWAIDVVQRSLDALPMVPPDNILGVEMKILDETPDGVPFIGFIDLALYDRETEELIIWDWKVTSHKKSMTELASNLQLNSYGFFKARDTGAKRVKGVNWYPPLAAGDTVVLSEAAREDAILQIESVVEMIEEDEKYEPRPGEACSWCPMKSICPAWTEVSGALTELEGF